MLKLNCMYLGLLKLFLLNICFLCSTYAQNKLIVFGGFNSSQIKYNDNSINKRINISAQNGFNIGFEYPVRSFVAGASYLQRGTKVKDNTIENISGVDYKIEIGGYEVFNYAAAHLHYPILISSEINSFIGFQFTGSLGGASITKLNFVDFNSNQTDELKLNSRDFNLDVGLHFGADYMMNNKFGIRATYFSGLLNVKKTISDSLNYKNNSFSLSALYKINGLKKKVRNKKVSTKTNSNSRLLLPENVVEFQFENRSGSTISSQSKLTLGYGIKDFITLEVSKSNYLNTSDFSFRTNYLNKLIKNFNYPLNIIFKSLISTQHDKPIIIDDYDKLSFLHQLIFEYKLGQKWQLILAPTLLHKNIAKTKLKPKGYPWDIWFIQTGLNFFYKENIQLYTSVSKQVSDEDISSGIKTGYKAGIQYYINTIGYDLSASNLHHLHGTAIAEDIGINNNDQKLRFGFQINKMFN